MSGAGRGIICHSTLAVTPEQLPLGLLAQHNWGVRDDETFGKLPSYKKRSVEDKESVKWLNSVVEALFAAREACPETTFVSVGDCEVDVFELFAMDRPGTVSSTVRIPICGKPCSPPMCWVQSKCACHGGQANQYANVCCPYAVCQSHSNRMAYPVCLHARKNRSECAVHRHFQHRRVASVVLQRKPRIRTNGSSAALGETVLWIAKLGGFLARKAMANQEHRCSVKDFSTCPTSQTCF